MRQVEWDLTLTKSETQPSFKAGEKVNKTGNTFRTQRGKTRFKKLKHFYFKSIVKQ